MIKKFTLFSLLVLLTFSQETVAQTIVLSENFNSYDGTSGTVPSGWNFSSQDCYTSSTSSGPSGPNSYKFSANNATVNTPMFINADTLSFWVKGNQTDSLSTLYVLESTNNSTWDTLDSIANFATSFAGETKKYAISNSIKYLRFIYVKSVGNCAFDDFMLTENDPLVSNFSANDACLGDTTFFTDLSVSDGNVNSWQWAFGDGNINNTTQHPYHIYSAAGSYYVSLTVVDDLYNVATWGDTIHVYGLNADFTSSVNLGVVAFTGDVSAGTGHYSYLWDFGDGSPNDSTLNPVHTYTAAGNYNVCLMVMDSLCNLHDTICDSVTIINTGIADYNNTRYSWSIYPNPSSNGVFALDGNGISKKAFITIYNITGKIILTKEINSVGKQVIDLSGEANGSYFIKIQTEKESIVRKITINN